MQIATPFPCPVCICECVFALRAIDIGSVNLILSTSLQQQGIIHQNNTNMHVAWHICTGTHKCISAQTHTHRACPLRCPLHMPG